MEALKKTHCPLSGEVVECTPFNMHPMEHFIISMQHPEMLLPGETFEGQFYDTVVRENLRYPLDKNLPKGIDLNREMVIVEADPTDGKPTGVVITTDRNDINVWITAHQINENPEINPQEVIDWAEQATSDKWGYMYLNPEDTHKFCEDTCRKYPVPNSI